MRTQTSEGTSPPEDISNRGIVEYNRASEISWSPEEISWSFEVALELAEGAVVDDMVVG
jgi:hypothetical protein